MDPFFFKRRNDRFDIAKPFHRLTLSVFHPQSLIARSLYGVSGGSDCCIPLDWGAVVPLSFLGHRSERKPKIVHMSPTRALPLETHCEFGRLVGGMLKETDKRIALIASADQGHTHNVDGS